MMLVVNECQYCSSPPSPPPDSITNQTLTVRMLDPAITEEKVLTPAERKALHQRCIDARIENEKYLRSHPELALVLNEALRLILIRRPDEPVAFIEDFLATQDLQALKEQLEKNTRLSK